ncbi:BGTF surface domain-containing protein [Natrarchaeobius oligotrophus]|uniref:PGF-CTERM sorting domain-containing protein n=1 Tax=Natrarchaeobius chitinivorans TaxID=1679083 RepID=A0A3N6MCR3_NATCH|nr:BGTF surface domain-containing protein [Natrarchaeobius chitinivorans]RQG98534.1 PGF-CTERM sorting domain-containing protein [Natrarchaeobius chitinivorans]
MTSETSLREKGRAVFLAALMVLSVVAMSAAFAGAGAATDEDLSSGSTYWQGQELNITNTDGTVDHDADLQIREYDGDGDIGSLVNEFSLENDQAVVETDGLESGDYVITEADNRSQAIEFDSNGVASQASSPSDAVFEITTQNLDVEFDDDQVNDGDSSTTDLDIDSNRGTYSVIVSADGDLSDEELFNIFVDDPNAQDIYDDIRDDPNTGNTSVDEDLNPTSGTIADATFGEFNAAVFADGEDDSDEQIVLIGINDREEEVDFHGIDAGEYELEFDVVDSTAEDTATIEVVEEDVDGAFDQSVYTQTAGDIVEFTVELEDTDETWIQIGDEDAGFIDIVHVEDDDDTGEVSFKVNTRTLGAHDADAEDVYDAGDDELTSEVHDGIGSTGADFHDEEVGDQLGTTGDFADYLDELGLVSSASDYRSGEEFQLTRPLQATDYDVAANGNGDFIVDSDGESELDDELDLATLDLTTPGVDSISTWVAPSDSADEDGLDELNDIVTERTDIAEDDRLIIKAEATGLYGALVDFDSDGWDSLEDGFEASTLESLVDDDYEGINFEVEADDATGNQDPTALNLGADEDAVFVLADNDAGELYVVVDTSDSDAFDRSIEDGMDFTAELEYETDSDERYAYDTSNLPGSPAGAFGDGTTEDAYPYFSADSTQSVSTEFTIVEPEVAFDNLDEDDNVQLETSDEFTISGETNIAPGSDATVRIRNAGDTPSFLHTLEDTEIASDGTFESESVDLSDRSEGDEGELQFRISGSTIGTADAIFVDELATDDDEPIDDDADDEEPVDDGADDDEPADDDADDEPVDTDDSTDDSSDDTTDDSDDVPGFGVAVALVALLAAAMLALRRQH